LTPENAGGPEVSGNPPEKFRTKKKRANFLTLLFK